MSIARSRPLAAAVALLAGVALTACSDGDGDGDGDSDAAVATTSPEAHDDTVDVTATSAADDPAGATDGVEAFCDGAMRRLAEYNGQQNAIDEAGTDWSALRAALLETRDESDQLYGEAIDAAPAEITSQLETLRTFSADTLAAAEGAESLEAFAELLGDVPADVVDATTELNSYLQEHCGFGLSRG